jgi:hypothetical protein
MSSCRGCGSSGFSPEYNKQFKQENNAGCGVYDPETCDKPSLATEGSALYEWEKIHGRVITVVEYALGEDGRFVHTLEKTLCPLPVEKSGPVRCCSFRFKVVR